MKTNKIVIFLLCILFLGIMFNSEDSNKSLSINRLNYKEAELFIKSEKYYIENSLIKPVELKTSKTDFIDRFTATSGTLILTCSNKTDYVGTDCLLQTKNETQVTSEHGIVVYGDVTGDGQGTITDIAQMSVYSENKEGITTNAKKEAGDIDYNKDITIDDAISLSNHIMENVDIPLPNAKQVKTVIELSTTNITLEKNDSKKVVATTNKGDTTILGWESDNKQVATVDNTGLITGVGKGNTTITVTASDGTSKKITVNVIVPVTGVSLNNNTLTIPIKNTATLIATISPTDASNKDVTWTSSKPNIASVNKGVVTAESEGTTIITVTTVDGNYTATCEVTVVIPVTGVKLDQNSLSLTTDSTKSLTATIEPSNATNQKVKWSSTKEEVASVDDTGKITPKTAGKTNIVVTTVDGNFTASCEVTVTVAVTGVEINNPPNFITINNQTTLNTTVSPANATNKKITWESSDNNIATVSNGTVTGKSRGLVTITATTEDGSKTDSCTVRVGYYDKTSINLNATDVNNIQTLKLKLVTEFNTRTSSDETGTITTDSGTEFKVRNVQGFNIRKNSDGYSYFWILLHGMDINDAGNNIALMRYKFTKSNGNVELHNFGATGTKTSYTGPFALGHGNDLGYDSEKNRMYVSPGGYSTSTCTDCNNVYQGLFKFGDSSTVEESLVFSKDNSKINPASIEVDSENRLLYMRSGDNFYTYGKSIGASDFDESVSYIEHFSVDLGNALLVRQGIGYHDNKIYYPLYCNNADVDNCNINGLNRGENIIKIIDITNPTNSKTIKVPLSSFEESTVNAEIETIAWDYEGDAYILAHQKIGSQWKGAIYQVTNKEVLDF